MGLMNFLEPFATGYLGASVDRMQATAEAKAKKKELEDKYKLEETLEINLQNNRFENEADLIATEKESKKQAVTDILNAEGMSPELQIMLAPYTTDLQTYNSFLENSGYKGYGWFKEPVPFVERNNAGVNIYEGMTFENFILSENKKMLDTKQEDTQNSLTSSGGVLENQPNTAKSLISSSVAEDVVGTATTVQSSFPASFDEPTTQQLNLAQIQETGEIEQEDSNTGFTGVAIPFSQFNIKRVADVTNTERLSRDRNIATALSPNFEGIIVGENGSIDASNLKGFQLTRWNTLTQFSNEIARTAEEDFAEFLTPNEIVQQALAKEQDIKDKANNHVNGVINPIYDLAVKANVVTRADAIEYTVYQDIVEMSPTEVQYYMQVASTLGDKGNRLNAFINSAEFRQPDGFDDIANRIDDAVIGSINVDSENIYNDDGELITRGDIDAPIFDKDSAGEKVEEDLFGETTADPNNNKIITPKVEDGITTYDLSTIDVGDTAVELPTVTGTQRRDAIKTSDSITVKGKNDEDIVLTLGNRVKIGNFIFKIGDDAMQSGMANTLEFENLGTEKNVSNPKLIKLNEIKTKIKELNQLEKNIDKESRFGIKKTKKQKLNEINTLKQEIETAIKDLQGE
jgi:hypothetical protein